MKASIILSILFITSINAAIAQCAMCRATLENNVSNGDPGIAAGINLGILYLFVAPYLAVAVVAFFWFKTSKSNARKGLEGRAILR